MKPLDQIIQAPAYRFSEIVKIRKERVESAKKRLFEYLEQTYK